MLNYILNTGYIQVFYKKTKKLIDLLITKYRQEVNCNHYVIIYNG